MRHSHRSLELMHLHQQGLAAENSSSVELLQLLDGTRSFLASEGRPEGTARYQALASSAYRFAYSHNP